MLSASGDTDTDQRASIHVTYELPDNVHLSEDDASRLLHLIWHQLVIAEPEQEEARIEGESIGEEECEAIVEQVREQVEASIRQSVAASEQMAELLRPPDGTDPTMN